MTETVLVTGVSGFIAKHVALHLLKNGYRVIGTVRSDASAQQVQATLSSHGADLNNFSILKRDLESETGWDSAMQGVDFVQHIASPCPMKLPEDREALVPAAVEGTLRVLKSAMNANVKRIVMTSSMVAMMYRPYRAKKYRVVVEEIFVVLRVWELYFYANLVDLTHILKVLLNLWTFSK